MSVPGSIVCDFVGSKKPRDQIRILSDLYQKSQRDIALILRDAGVLPKGINPEKLSDRFRPVQGVRPKEKHKPEKKKSRKNEPVDTERILRLYQAGGSDRAIAAAVGCSTSYVQKIRFGKGLPSNFTRGQKKERPAAEEELRVGAQMPASNLQEKNRATLEVTRRKESRRVTIRMTIEVKGCGDDPQGVKEAAAVALEKIGSVRVVDVAALGAPEQMKMEG